MKWLLLLLTSLTALADPQSGLVKVVSERCGDAASRREGSGTLLALKGRILVVTSEHVVYHRNQGYCHFVEGEDFGIRPANLLVADAGLGVALLSLDSLPDKTLALLSDSFGKGSPPPQRNAPVLTLGIPSGKNFGERVADANGYVVFPKSTVPALPCLTDLIEIKGAFGTYGMSGGELWDASGTERLGMLSHKYWKEAGISSFGPRAPQGENHLLVIPTAKITHFIDEYLADPGQYRPKLVRDPDAQIQGLEDLSSGALKFSPGKDSAPRARTGGADGISGRTGNIALVSVHIRWSPTEAISHWTLPSLQRWLARVELQASKADAEIEVPYFVGRENGTLVKVGIESLPHFFHLMENTRLTPLTLISPASPQSKISVARFQQEAEGLELGRLAFASSLTGVAARTLLERISFLSEVIKGDWELVSALDLETILADAKGWQELFALHFENARDLNFRLRQARDLLAKVRVEP